MTGTLGVEFWDNPFYSFKPCFVFWQQIIEQKSQSLASSVWIFTWNVNEIIFIGIWLGLVFFFILSSPWWAAWSFNMRSCFIVGKISKSCVFPTLLLSSMFWSLPKNIYYLMLTVAFPPWVFSFLFICLYILHYFSHVYSLLHWFGFLQSESVFHCFSHHL